MARVLVVGKGAPEHGGIPSFVDLIMTSRRLLSEHDMRFMNLTRATPPQGGRATVANLRRTVKDAVDVWQAAKATDVVHLHTALAPGVTAARAGLLGIVARARGARVLLHVHGGLVPVWARGTAQRSLLGASSAPASTVVSVSVSVAEALHRAPGGRRRVRVLDNGVDLTTFGPVAGEGANPLRVLFVGLLTPRKGVVDLLDASLALRADGVEHELCLVGGTPDEGEHAEREVRVRLTDDVRLLGTVAHADMPDVYRTAGVFCLPSWYEAMPLSVLEAMASGLPVVATDVGDVSRLVVDGETGFVVPPRDPAALASSLARLLGDPALRASMGEAGRSRVEQHFSANAVTARLSEMYDELGGHRQ